MCLKTTMSFFASSASSNPDHPNACASCRLRIAAARLRSVFVIAFFAPPLASPSSSPSSPPSPPPRFASNFAADTVIFVDASPSLNSV